MNLVFLANCLSPLIESTLIQGREELEHKSQRLEEHIKVPNSEVSLVIGRVDGLHVAGEIVVRLQAWKSAPSSQTLWIMGNPQPLGKTSAVAAHVVAIAETANIPCLSFFCHLANMHNPRKDPEKHRQDQLTTLLYALIRQLLILTPERFEDSYNFNSALDCLQGSPEYIPKALDIIRALLVHAPRLLLCVIDGLQLLDHRDTNSYIDQLLDALRSQNNSRVFKLLLTTIGSFSSGRKLNVIERLDSTALPRKRPGKALPGGLSLQGLSFS